MSIPFQYHDGGRVDAGFRGHAGDCVTRSIAIATGLPYIDVYNALAHGQSKLGKSRSARNGVNKKVYRPYIESLGWEWIPTVSIGSGCKIHLHPDELPYDKLIVRVSKHITTMINGVIYDTYDPSRNGTRCVYGYWEPK